MNRTVVFQDLGRIGYAEAWEYQKSLFESLIQHKAAKKEVANPNYLIFCEHPPVFTLGKHGQENNLLIDEAKRVQEGIDFFRIDRGGDITYHGPGQLVGYLVFDLDNFAIGLRRFVENIEQAIITLLRRYDIQGEQIQKASGVWIEQSRKICALGIRASRMVTMHGFALNVHPNLEHFSFINPCGFTDKTTTSMESEGNRRITLAEVKVPLLESLAEEFQATLLDDAHQEEFIISKEE